MLVGRRTGTLTGVDRTGAAGRVVTRVTGVGRWGGTPDGAGAATVGAAERLGSVGVRDATTLGAGGIAATSPCEGASPAAEDGDPASGAVVSGG